MIETLLNQLADRRKRRMALITVTALSCLLFLWPAVEDYLSARQHYADLQLQLEDTRQAAESLGQYETQVNKQRELLDHAVTRTVPPSELEAFRGSLVQLVRQADCRLRQIRVSTPETRPWYEQDQAVGALASERGDETPFMLVTQRLEVQLSGPAEKVRDFLASLHGMDKMLHTSKMLLRKSEENESLVQLELELIAFDLTRKAQNPSP